MLIPKVPTETASKVAYLTLSSASPWGESLSKNIGA